MYFERVRSPLKRGVDARLTQRTVVVGPNGAGKTSIIQALELATRGQVSELEGRNDVKAVRALKRLFPGDELWADAFLSNGTKFHWDPGTLEAPRPVRWPVQELMAVFKSEEATVRSWLEGQVSGQPTADDVLALVDKASHTVVSRLLRKGKVDFLELAKAAKDEAKALRSQATRSEKTIDKMVEGVPPALLDSERKKLEAEVAALALPSDGITQTQHTQAQLQLDAAIEAYQQADLELTLLPPLDPEVSQAVNHVNAALRLVREHQHVLPGTHCWVCGKPDPDLEARDKELRALLVQLTQMLPDGAQRSRLEGEKARWWNQMETLFDYLKRPVVDTTQRDQLMSKLARDDTARRAWANAHSQRAVLRGNRADADNLTRAAEQLEEEGLLRLKQRKVSFEARVSKYLPALNTLGIDLESARIGFARDGSIHSALSGSELTRALLALSAASVEGDELSVLAPEDRSWDALTLHTVMQALADAPGQIVLMSTVVPALVEGWSLLEVG